MQPGQSNSVPTMSGSAPSACPHCGHANLICAMFSMSSIPCWPVEEKMPFKIYTQKILKSDKKNCLFACPCCRLVRRGLVEDTKRGAQQRALCIVSFYGIFSRFATNDCYAESKVVYLSVRVSMQVDPVLLCPGAARRNRRRKKDSKCRLRCQSGSFSPVSLIMNNSASAGA